MMSDCWTPSIRFSACAKKKESIRVMKKDIGMKKNEQTPENSHEKGDPPQPSPFSNSRAP